MGTLLVVLEHPPPGGLADILEAPEQVLVEHLLPERAIESFDVGVLIGLAGLDVLDSHALVLGPFGEGFAQELRAVVGSQHLRKATLALEPLEDPDQAQRRDRSIDLDVQRLSVEVVLDVERPEPAAASQRVGHEVRRPHRVRHPRDIQRHALALGQAAPGGAAAIQSHGLVNPVDALVVPLRPAPSQQLAALPEAPGGPVFDELGQRRDDLGVADRPVQRRPVPSRPG